MGQANKTLLSNGGVLMARDDFDPDEMREMYMRKIGASLKQGGLLFVGLVILGVLVAVSLVKGYVPAGHVGVLTQFGTVKEGTLTAGTRPVWPWLVNNRMSVRTQELKEKASVPSNEMLTVTLDTSLLFRLDAERANEVYSTIGLDYLQKVVEPSLRSAIRDITATHTASALYTEKRQLVAQQIEDQLRTALQERGVVVEKILLREVKLPQMLAKAIEVKQQAEREKSSCHRCSPRPSKSSSRLSRRPRR
jgi:regulator of protease activity HflC (stomatin/prohibitin superfamily)